MGMRSNAGLPSLLLLALVLAGCSADPVGGTGVRGEMPANIGSSTPDSFLPQTPQMPQASTVAPGPPASNDPTPAAAPPGDGDAAGPQPAPTTSPDAGTGEPGRQPIPLCDASDIDEDAGADPPSGCAVAGDLVVQYRVSDGAPGDQDIRAQFNLINDGSTAIPLEELTLRYWYTKETEPAVEEFHCDYARIGSQLVMGSFHDTDLPGVDRYMELSFSGGTLPAGGDTGEIQTRWNTQGWPNYDESDDYSYDGTVTQYEDWERVTLYLNGTLIWGAEPH